jgi:hypothetical protein
VGGGGGKRIRLRILDMLRLLRAAVGGGGAADAERGSTEGQNIRLVVAVVVVM